MKIVVDLQGAQSESRHRGIGRYAKSMLTALADTALGEHDIWVVLNSRLDHDIESLRGLLDGLVPQERILGYALPGPLAAAVEGNDWRRHAAELLRENFVRDLRADWVWQSSLFEGWLDDAATSTGLLASAGRQAATLHDLIPLKRPEEYLVDARVRAWYMRKIEHLQQQDLCLANSHWTRQEGELLLGLPAERIVVATCGVENVFKPIGAATRDIERQRLRLVHAIDKPFVFYMGGFDTRKNVAQLITAFGRLSSSLRQTHQLVIGGRISDGEQAFLRSLMSKSGISVGDAIFTGQIDDEELVKLYCHCALFVFPSLHEGFGLTVLEAMACGAPVLAADATSLPEVIGRADMLFDPTDPDDLAARMTRVLADPALQQEWSEYGKCRAQKFSWRRGAEQMLEAFEKGMSLTSLTGRNVPKTAPSQRLRLAYVSPLPPEPSGISDYSAELLPALAADYAIDVIVQQTSVSDSWINANLPVRSVEWFEQNAHRFDRILYHFGNSPFHLHMFELLERFPGTVVLHDSFLGGLSHWRSFNAGVAEDYRLRLYRSHGYRALMDDHELGREESMRRYPGTAEIIESSVGIIVHSRYAVDQVKVFYGNAAASWMRTVEFPKKQHSINREAARRQLGLPSDAFVVCSFGMLAPTKLNHRLLDAWLASSLAACSTCRLVFVGENHGGDYGQALTRCIAGAHATSAIEIAGFASDEVYKAWLAAADVAVQLRTESRGETSAAVFDCLGHGLPLIVNAHATFNELSDDCVVKVTDDFTNDELVAALENLAASETLRHQLGGIARTRITDRHAPARVAAAYRDAIETFATSHPMAGECAAIDALAAIDGVASEPSDLWLTSSALVRNRKPMRLPCLLLDVTAVSGNDLKTGIERVTRNLARELMKDSSSGYRVEPVRIVDGHYRYAHHFATRLLGLPDLHKVDDPVDPVAGDVFLGLDWVADKVPEQVPLFQSWRDRGVAVHFMVYDLLPVLKPQFFPQGMDRMHARWLRSIASCADGLIAISETVAHELRLWLNVNPASRERNLALGYSHIGADLDGDIAMAQLTLDEELLLKQLAERPTILVVGTIEPRKGQQQVLAALDELWSREQDLNLIIVGKQGWMMEDFGQRISQHPETGERLFWHAGISDALLKKIYKLASVLVVASEGEGFGLPLIEAAQQGIPVIARNLPVFREVAGPHASYFESDEPNALADTISNWFAANAVGGAPDSVGMRWLSWKQSADHLAAMLRSGDAPGWLQPWLNEHDPGIVVPREGLQLIPGRVEGARFINWGDLESWGRWALELRPRIQLRLLDMPDLADLQLKLVANAFVTDNHPSQCFSIYANGYLLGDWMQHARDSSDGSATYRWIIPAQCIGQSGELELTVVQEQSISPAMLALSTDTRMLGLAVSQLSLHWNEKKSAMPASNDSLVFASQQT